LEQREAVQLPEQGLTLDAPSRAMVWGPDIALVRGAARVSGGRGDALVDLHEAEHRRRSAVGLCAVTDLGLLDRLLALPSDEVVRWDDLSQDDARRLRAAPEGVVECTLLGVRRVLSYPVSVPLVLVRSRSWRRGLQRASAFEPFAQRVLILEGTHRDLRQLTWEADVTGVGVWIQDDSAIRVVVSPAPWRQLYVKAAAWRFRERAYQCLVNAMRLEA
jgi:hypothetical protein